MIVKNEEHIIGETLELLAKYIKFDYWVICDTGSTDDTMEIIRDYFANVGISGELIESEWKDFGHNRTEALKHAYGKTDYVFIWDADDEIVGDFNLPNRLVEDAYTFQFGGNNHYRRIQLVKNTLSWKYVGVIHEYITSVDVTRSPFFIDGKYHFISGRRGSRNKNPNKYRDDAVTLEDAYIEAIVKKDPIQTRYAFYTANSYRDANIPEKAIEYYKKVLELDGWDQEKYVSCFELYELLKRTNGEVYGLYYLLESIQYDKSRIECIYRLVKHYFEKNMYDVAYMYYTLVKDNFENNFDFLGKDRLFVKKQDYIFNLPMLLVPICAKLKNVDII
jgi:glycosyltransferase involved in cell wall biosynthesis